MPAILTQYFATLLIWGKYMFVFLLLEYFFAAQKQPIKGKLFNVHYLLYYTLAFLFLIGLTNQLVLQSSMQKAPQLFGWFEPMASIGPVAYTLLYLLAYDFFYYWYHRSQHQFSWLWRVHRLHHADQHLNVTTTMRHHWLEEPLKVVVVALPLALLFKLPPPDLGWMSVLLGAWAFFIHSNLRLHLGPLSRVIVGPQAHRIHHSKLAEHTDKNFAALFPIWDILFGTYLAPKVGEFPPTGLHGDLDFDSMLAANLSPLIAPTLIAPTLIAPTLIAPTLIAPTPSADSTASAAMQSAPERL